MTQLDMFPDWVPAAQLPAKKVNPRKAGIAYLRYRPSGRVLCDDCKQRILAVGIDVAPYPRSVRWKRVASDGKGIADIAYLCDPHRQERQANES